MDALKNYITKYFRASIGEDFFVPSNVKVRFCLTCPILHNLLEML
jgi:hypothetical protein